MSELTVKIEIDKFWSAEIVIEYDEQFIRSRINSNSAFKDKHLLIINQVLRDAVKNKNLVPTNILHDMNINFITLGSGK